MNPKVIAYLLDGCMQCKLGATPACKIHRWQSEVQKLREIITETNLTEDFKWKHPCYTFENKNIVLIHVFNQYCALLFPKGVLITDTEGILVQQTENSQTARQMRFTHLEEINLYQETIKKYLLEAIELEKNGAKVQMKKTAEFNFPDELKEQFSENPGFEKAFFALTPGRQRGYLLHFSQAKQATTRTARIEKYKPLIFNGKGMND